MSSIRSLFAALVLAPAALFAQDVATAAGPRPSITIGAFEYGSRGSGPAAPAREPFGVVGF